MEIPFDDIDSDRRWSERDMRALLRVLRFERGFHCGVRCIADRDEEHHTFPCRPTKAGCLYALCIKVDPDGEDM